GLAELARLLQPAQLGLAGVELGLELGLAGLGQRGRGDGAQHDGGEQSDRESLHDAAPSVPGTTDDNGAGEDGPAEDGAGDDGDADGLSSPKNESSLSSASR